MSNQIKQQLITPALIESSQDYAAYRGMIDELLEQGKTTGENHSESMLEYTRMNVKRMKKWDKIAKLDSELIDLIKNIPTPQHWLVITEAWCGDAAQNLPWFNKMAEENENISLSFILRDEHLDVMDAYLTDGGRGIPKLIILDEELNTLASWGPRPETARQMLINYKNNKDTMTYQDFANQLHLYYGKIRGKEMQEEFIQMFKNINS